MTNPICVDLSHWNPTPDWDALLQGGTLGIIHKATEGTKYLDPTLYARIGAASDAGLLVSTYHFMRPFPVEQQMDWYLSQTDPVDGARVVLDHEDAAVSLADLEACVEYLWAVRPDLQVTIYTGNVGKQQLGNNKSETLSKTALWIAQYTGAPSPSWPKGTWPTWSLWQYTDAAQVVGISALVDANRWNGNPEAFVRWMTPTSELEPVPSPEPIPGVATSDVLRAYGHEVSVSIDETGVLIHVDGEPWKVQE